jgi:CheY-like chemotaxis protein
MLVTPANAGVYNYPKTLDSAKGCAVRLEKLHRCPVFTGMTKRGNFRFFTSSSTLCVAGISGLIWPWRVKLLKVLIVDDSPLLRERLKILISEVEGVFVIGESENAQSALESVDSLKPDLVVLDINLPDSSGITVLKTIKARKQAPVVMMLTNFPYPQYRQKCIDYKADYFFCKATDLDHVTETLERIIQKNGPAKATDK